MSLTRRYSDRLGTLTDTQLQAAADRFELGKVLGAEPAPAGLFGQNVFLSTEGGEFVLRGHPHGHWQLTKERLVAERIHTDTSLDAPWPYRICDDPSIFGWTFAIMPKLPGSSFGQEEWRALDGEVRRELLRALGDGAARLHEARSDAPASYDIEADAFVSFDGGLRAFVEGMITARLEADDRAWFDRLVDAADDAFAVPFTPALVHHDLMGDNVLFTDGRVSGVVDLFEAFYGDGEQDLVRTLCFALPEERPAFLEGYTAREVLREGAADRIAVYAAADRLVIYEYGRRPEVGWFDDATTLRAYAEPYVEELTELIGRRPVARLAARLIVLAPDGAVLLQRFSDDTHSWWVCPGGGLHAGEDVRDGARREAREELGLEVDDVGPEVWHRRHVFPWGGSTLDQRERFFLLRVGERFAPDPAIGEDGLRAEGVREQRWWTVEEIEAQTDQDVDFAPKRLGPLLRDLLEGEIPAEPVDAGM